MRSEALGAVFCICATVLGVKYFERSEGEGIFSSQQATTPVAASAQPVSPVSPYQAGYSGYEVRIPEGQHHQYFVTAAVNRRPFSFLVDTGASYVALRRSDARRAQIHVDRADFTYEVRTANGITNAALVDIDDIEIDLIRIKNVKAFILPDEQLGTNLLGMSFLSKLESVEARQGELVLRG